MKKIFSTIVVCGSFLVSQASVLTVSNNANSPGQYTNLQTAIDSASPGDSIYVHGSTTSYGNVTVKKALSFFGTGHNPNKSNTLVAQVGIIQLDSLSSTSGASGTRIIGFKVNRISGYSGTGGTKNIYISRNYFISGGTKITITGSNWIIENNIINSSSINVNNKDNIIIRNNIFDNANINTSNQTTVLISNNIFLASFGSALSIVSNALITNNIFSGATPKASGVDANNFSNNITYQTSYDTIPFGTNIGSGNFVAQNPQFTNVPSNSFSYSYDFTLSPISLGKNAGTDGTDIGVYGGNKPFVDMTGSPSIPQVKNVTILNPVIPVGDSLRVIIKAKKQN